MTLGKWFSRLSCPVYPSLERHISIHSGQDWVSSSQLLHVHCVNSSLLLFLSRSHSSAFWFRTQIPFLVRIPPHLLIAIKKLFSSLFRFNFFRVGKFQFNIISWNHSYYTPLPDQNVNNCMATWLFRFVCGKAWKSFHGFLRLMPTAYGQPESQKGKQFYLH
jgi:hypothetical protein